MSKYLELKQHIDLKSDNLQVTDLLFIHPVLLVILAHISLFCHKHGINFQLTSIIRTLQENKDLKSKSTTHVDGRAFDFSVREEHGWTYELIQRLINELNLLYGKYGALSKRDKIGRVIIVHDGGHGKHAHVQIKPGL